MEGLKITIISTFDKSGGAATAAFRHVNLLRKAGLNARMVVRSKSTETEFIHQVHVDWLHDRLDQFREWGERLSYVTRAASRDQWFYFSHDQWGERIDQHPWVREADILHLHWFHKGFLSLDSLQHLARLDKPMVWQLHDMWAFTGGCHYAGGCKGYETQCGHCPYLRSPGPHDLSHQIWSRKSTVYPTLPLSIVTCSQWLANVARSSSLLQSIPVKAIANGIDTTFYSPGDPMQARRNLGLPEDGIHLLFVAMNTREKRKGFKELRDALHEVVSQQDPKVLSRLRLTVLGKTDPEVISDLPLPVDLLGFRSAPEEIRDAYRAADFFLLPSLEDNLPNTVMEAQACGCPTIAFHTGGVPEMIEHLKSGFLADHGSASSLADGIQMAVQLDAATKSDWKQTARKTTCEQYSYEVIASRYLAHYHELLASPHRG